MGINIEYCAILNMLHREGILKQGGRVLEFGSQDISADPVQMAKCRSKGVDSPQISSIDSAQKLYTSFGFTNYTSIDASGANGSIPYDINFDISEKYKFTEQFDLVTDLGTFEHCFNIGTAFKNAHSTCTNGGIMIHALPSQGNVNHGFYNVHPTLFDMLAAANGYTIIDILFTVDYKQTLYRYDTGTYRIFDDRDILVYYIIIKSCNKPFCMPFDGIFAQDNKIPYYEKTFRHEKFHSYIKGTWENVKAAYGTTGEIALSTRLQRTIKKAIDWLGSKK